MYHLHFKMSSWIKVESTGSAAPELPVVCCPCPVHSMFALKLKKPGKPIYASFFLNSWMAFLFLPLQRSVLAKWLQGESVQTGFCHPVVYWYHNPSWSLHPHYGGYEWPGEFHVSYSENRLQVNCVSGVFNLFLWCSEIHRVVEF